MLIPNLKTASQLRENSLAIARGQERTRRNDFIRCVESSMDNAGRNTCITVGLEKLEFPADSSFLVELYKELENSGYKVSVTGDECLQVDW